jgi:hypothetical protein
MSTGSERRQGAPRGNPEACSKEIGRPATAARLDLVSATTSRMWSIPESRALSESRRSMAWTSRSLVSASTGKPTPSPGSTKPEIQPSHARRSPGIGSGTSCRRTRRGSSRSASRAISLACDASLIGSGPGYARMRTSSPTTAPIRASWRTRASGTIPRSIRITCVADRPTRSPTNRSDRPALDARCAELLTKPRQVTVDDATGAIHWALSARHVTSLTAPAYRSLYRVWSAHAR